MDDARLTIVFLVLAIALLLVAICLLTFVSLQCSRILRNICVGTSGTAWCNCCDNCDGEGCEIEYDEDDDASGAEC